MNFEIIGPEAEALLGWHALADALEAGHRLPVAGIGDTFLYRGADTLLSRSAWIDGMGIAVKSATIFPGNPARGIAAVNGGVMLYSDAAGLPEALVDFHLVTRWKTAGDSFLAARHLARPDARAVLIVGAGKVAASMIAAYRALIPGARVTLWNRTARAAHALATLHPGVEVAEDLAEAVGRAEVIATTTMAAEPLIRGEWLRPGTHLDLIGAYRPDMREVDDEALRRARIFVDSRATTLAHIGELKDPIARGVISQADILADFYDITAGLFRRRSADEITIAKNGGGAHLDLMTARFILERVRAAK
ncbi:MAG: ornithine cyclodeaminase family protein [Gemmobacter sp.]